MRITQLQKFWFGERLYSDAADHPDYLTLRFSGEPNIDAQLWLTIMSPGATFSGGAVTAIGGAAVGIKSYMYRDEQGNLRIVLAESWDAHIRLRRAISITFAFHVRLAWAKAEGMIYYWE